MVGACERAGEAGWRNEVRSRTNEVGLRRRIAAVDTPAMKWQSGIPQEAQREVRRIVVLTRLAGLFVVLSLTAGSVYIHRGALTSSESVFQFATILVGALAFVALSTLARLSHASIIQRSLSAVRSLSDQLREIADRDPLTGLYNLRAFQERLLCDLEEAAVAGACVSLIIADLDNFKLLNDSFGHQYGDEVLRRTARVFERAGSGQSYVARLGGDEFAMVLPGIERTDAVVVARGVESSWPRCARTTARGRRSAASASRPIRRTARRCKRCSPLPMDGCTARSIIARPRRYRRSQAPPGSSS